MGCRYFPGDPAMVYHRAVNRIRAGQFTEALGELRSIQEWPQGEEAARCSCVDCVSWLEATGVSVSGWFAGLARVRSVLIRTSPRARGGYSRRSGRGTSWWPSRCRWSSPVLVRRPWVSRIPGLGRCGLGRGAIDLDELAAAAANPAGWTCGAQDAASPAAQYSSLGRERPRYSSSSLSASRMAWAEASSSFNGAKSPHGSRHIAPGSVQN